MNVIPTQKRRGRPSGMFRNGALALLNVLRSVPDTRTMRNDDLARLLGKSKNQISSYLGYLVKEGHIQVERSTRKFNAWVNLRSITVVGEVANG